MGYVQFFTAIRAKCFVVIAENDVSPFFDRLQTLMAFPIAFVPYLNRDPKAGHSLFTRSAGYLLRLGLQCRQWLMCHTTSVRDRGVKPRRTHDGSTGGLGVAAVTA
jgi:hypothetical protein